MDSKLEMVSNKTSILFIDNTFAFGGAINSLHCLFKALDNKLYTPILITGQSAQFLKEHFKGFIYYRLTFKLPWINNKIYKKILSLRICRNKYVLKIINSARFLYWSIFINLPEAFRYFKIGKRHNVKIVHLNNILGGQLSGIIASKLLKVPCVAHLRDFEEVDVITKFYARMIDHHIAISSAIKKNLMKLEIPQYKISLVWNSLDPEEIDNQISCQYLFEEFNIKKEERLFGIFGRIIKWKGIKEFILSASCVFEKIPEAKAFIVGDSSDSDKKYYHSMKALVHSLGLKNKIIFTGFRDDMLAMMKMMDVVAHASIKPEPFGRVLIEAMAMGKPVVATRAGGPLDIVVDGETGILVDMADTVKMSAAIEKLLTDPLLAKKMGQNGKNRVAELFCKEKHTKEIEKIYQNLSK